jgi:uncharacterized protein (DUF169 family)
MTDLKNIDEALTAYLRPQTYPVAVRMCESAAELPERAKYPVRDLGLTVSLCHALTMTRRYGWTLAVDKQQSCWAAGLSMGFLPLLPDIVDGSYQASLGLWGMTAEAAAAMVRDLPKFAYDRYKYVLMAPLHRAAFTPDLVLIYGNPAQIWVLLASYLTSSGKTALETTLAWGAGCTTYITKAIQTDECQFALIGAGERLVPHPQDHESAFSIPLSKLDTVVKGLEMGHQIGVFRYPIPSFLRYDSQHPPGYDKMRSHLLGEE